MESEKSYDNIGGRDTTDAVFEELVADADTTSEDMLKLPEKCRNCPILRHQVEAIDRIREEAQEALEEDPEQLAKHLLVLKRMGHPQLVALSGEEVHKLAHDIVSDQRKYTAEQLEDLDARMALSRLAVEDFTHHCTGVLKMRGSRDGKTVTTTSCMSGKAAFLGGRVLADVEYS